MTTSHRGFSIRRLFAFLLAVLTAGLLMTTLLAHPAAAADAEWKSDVAITYAGNTYAGPANVDMLKALGLQENDTAYTYIDPSDTDPRLIHVVYFAATTNPTGANDANYRTYVYEDTLKFTNPSTPSVISLTPKDPNTSSVASAGSSSCQVDGGLGWIICPVTNTLANAMDWAFQLLTGFLEVRPIELDTNNGLYRAWSYMRTFANVAFVIAFIIIIYSQITSIGISNYGLKKLLPRLIVAAVLVNLSYIICALAIDISNILGHGVQHVFIQMRNGIVGGEGNSWELASFESITSFVLAGGGALAAGGIALASTWATYGIGGALVLLVPTLVGGILAVLVALLILAARQALITILTVIAPLAFVANLLPNTEDWFKRWQKLFMTMLIFFPAFSVVFGGSQFASAVIIQNAKDVNVTILAMAVQVAPLVLTPFLLKFSGSLLGRIAGLVNDPNRGILDRTKNWSKDRAENMKAKRMGTESRPWEIMKRTGQRLEHNRRKREGYRAAYNSMADANWANSSDFSNIDQLNREASDVKQTGEHRSGTRYEVGKVTNATLREVDISARQANLDLENAKTNATIENWEKNHSSPVVDSKFYQRVLKDQEAELHQLHDADYEEARTGTLPSSLSHAPNAVSYMALAQKSLEKKKIATDRATNATALQAEEYANLLQNNVALANEAAGIRGQQGYSSVLANAKKTASKFLVDDIQNIQDTMDYDIASNNLELFKRFEQAGTMSERVAYARTVSRNGAPGVEKLREMITSYENTNPAPADLNDFKELLAMQSNVMGVGKDIENWLTNEGVDIKDANGVVTGKKLKTLNEITTNNGTWLNLSANAFASQNAATHKLALTQLYDTDRAGYHRLVEMLRTSPQALAGIKQGVREKFSIYSEEEYKAARKAGTALPDPGTLI